MTVNYAAYASNLHLEQMLTRCPQAVRLCAGVIRDHRLLFRRTADIEPRLGHGVPVGLFRLSPSDERSLDRYEGHPRVYRKIDVAVETSFGTVDAMAYVMNRQDESAPAEEYARRIAKGYADWGFDPAPLCDALARCGIAVG